MKQLNAFLLLTFLSSMAFAGNSDDDKSFDRIYIGVTGSVSVSYRYALLNYIPQGSSQYNVDQFLSSRNKYEHPEAGIRIGPKFGINLTRWLAIETGIEYSQFAYRVSSNRNYYGIQPGLPFNDTLNTTLNYKYIYVSIPVALKFRFGKHRFRGLISPGANFDFLMKETETSYYVSATGQSSTTNTDKVRSFNISPYLGFGFDWYILKFMDLQVMPFGQMQALKNVDGPVAEYLWNVGAEVSLYFGFVRVNK
jgi:hypothetical protein